MLAMNAVVKATKGETTRAQILDAAVQQASEGGLQSLTIGTLAARTGLSKSGLFAHFGSRQDLQMAVLDESARLFAETVFLPALKAPRGLKRLRALFEHWIGWTERAKLPGGCPIQGASAEFDDLPGAMRDAVAERQRSLAGELVKTVRMAVETGELCADTDAPQFVFEMFGIVLACYQTQRLLGDAGASARALTAFHRLVESCCARASDVPPRPAAKRR
jgi:AcrR family transcriptional regulator